MWNWFWLLSDVPDFLDEALIDNALMCTREAPSGGTGSELRYPPPYSVEEYFCLHVPTIDALWFATMLSGQASLRVPSISGNRYHPLVSLRGGCTVVEDRIRLPKFMHKLWRSLPYGRIKRLNSYAELPPWRCSCAQTGLFWMELPRTCGASGQNTREKGLSISTFIRPKILPLILDSVTIKKASVSYSLGAIMYRCSLCHQRVVLKCSSCFPNDGHNMTRRGYCMCWRPRVVLE